MGAWHDDNGGVVSCDGCVMSYVAEKHSIRFILPWFIFILIEDVINMFTIIIIMCCIASFHMFISGIGTDQLGRSRVQS